MSGGITLPAHRKKHDLSSPIDHEGDIYEGLIAAVNAITALNPAADQKYVLDQILAALKGLDWQESVLSREAAQPATPSTGDRYIATATAGDWTKDSIYEWDGTAWVETVPNKGTTAVVEAEALAYTFIVTPSNAWVTLGSVIDHAALNNLTWSTARHTMDTDLPMDTFKVTGMGDPTLAQDAATKKYVDDFTSEPNQAIGLYVSDDRGNDTTGDGSLYNPFKTIQAAIDYGYATYFGDAIDIFVRSKNVFPFENVEIPPGMEVSISNEFTYMQEINLTVNQYCWVTIRNIGIGTLTENDDGDQKDITLFNSYLNTVIPTATPSIRLDCHDVYLDYDTIKTQIDDIYGYWNESISSGSILTQRNDPEKDEHIATKRYVDNALPGATTEDKQAVALFVSPKGNDTTGDGSLYNPFLTVQAAVDYALVKYPPDLTTVVEIIIHPNVTTSGIVVLYNQQVIMFRALGNRPAYINEIDVNGTVRLYTQNMEITRVRALTGGSVTFYPTLTKCDYLEGASNSISLYPMFLTISRVEVYARAAISDVSGWFLFTGPTLEMSFIPNKDFDEIPVENPHATTPKHYVDRRSWRTRFSYTNGGNTINLTDFEDVGVTPNITFGIELNGLAYDNRIQITPLITSLTHNGTHWVAVVRCNKTYYQAAPPGVVFDECATNDVDITIIAGGE